MVIVVGVVLMSAQTNTPAKKQSGAAAQKSNQPVAEPGQRVFIDPVTKQIKQPDQSDIDALNAAAPQKKAALRAVPAPAAQETVLENGAVMLQVDDSMMMYSVVTKTPDGKLVMGCVDGKQKADEVGSGKKTAVQEANNEK